MIDTPSHHAEAPLSSYDVAQLHFAIDQDSKAPPIDALAFDVNVLSGTASLSVLSPPSETFARSPSRRSSSSTTPSSDADLDYSSRRMSSSAASDDCSPAPSPAPNNKLRPDSNPAHWSPPQHDSRPDLDSPRVQLPSIASSFLDAGRRASLPSTLDADAHSRQNLRLPQPTLLRSSHSSSSLANYTFPESDTSATDKRPRLEANTELGLYPDYSVPLSSSTSSYSFSNNSPLSGGQAPPSSTTDDQWTRASTTPELKYDDSLRHQSLPSLYAGVSRISGHSQSDRARSGLGIPSIKAENDWTFPGSNATANSADYSSNMSPSASSVPVAVSPSRSPQQAASAATPNSLNGASSLVERPPRKRGKLPKPVTDFLKDWLHRHSDHPYPSEEEKKQLCHATGLSMSQVSNWMINARRRILAPAHRAAQGPTTNGPYASPLGGHPRPILDTGRRASMPADSLALYHPMSLQSLPDYSSPSSTRHLVSMTRSMSSGHASVGSLSAAAHHQHHAPHHHHPYGSLDSYARPSLYGTGSSGALHPSSSSSSHSQSGSGGYLSVPMSAPAAMSSPHSFSSHGGGGGGASYGRVSPDGHHHHHQVHHAQSQARYSFPASEHSVSPGPGSGYNTPH